MANIKDVAAAANVSIATVSNYLNKTKPVSLRSEQMIKQAIEQLNYTPNLFAKSLKSNIYYDIGIILPNLNDTYYSQIFQGIEKTFQNSEYFLNLAFSYDIPETERNIVNSFMKKNICGMILVTCITDDWHYYYDNFTANEKPLVLIDRMVNNFDCNFVSFNNRKTIGNLVRLLLEDNRKSIYLFTGPQSFYCESECIEGYKEAFSQTGLNADNSKIVTNVLNKEKAFRQTINLLKTTQPEVIITTSGLSAVGIIEALTILGFQKDEIPVITLGEEHWNSHTQTFACVSTVRPAIQMGETAANLLKNHIRTPKTLDKSVVILDDRITDFSLPLKSNKAASVKRPASKEINVLFLETPQTFAIQGLLPNFENLTGIRANIEILSHAYLYDRIFSEAKSTEKQSDVYMFDIPWLYSLASLGILADITGFIEDSSFDKNIFLPDCLKYFSEFDEKHYGLPFMYAPQILYYRKDLFENSALGTEYEKLFHSKLMPPRTWTEFTAVAEFFSNCTSSENIVKYGTSIPAAYKECMVPEIYMRLFSYGGRIFDKKFHVDFDTPQTLKAYSNFKSTLKYAKPDFRTATDLSAVSDFVKGETAMLISYPSFLTSIADLRTISKMGGTGFSLIPGRTPLLGGWSTGISAKSEKKADAFKFISWLSAEENARYITLLGGQPAVNSIFTNDELINLYPWLPLYQSAYKYTVPLVPPYKSGRHIISQDKIDEIVFKHVIELIDNVTDIPATIMKTQEDIETLFRNYGY